MTPIDGKMLDDPGLYSSLDPSGLGARIGGLPDHCRAAWEKADACTLPSEWSSVEKVVIGGMGGSAMAGDLASDLAAAQGTVPILVVRDPHLPFVIDGRNQLHQKRVVKAGSSSGQP